MSSRHTPDTIKLQTVVRLNRRPWPIRLIRAPYTFVVAYGIGRSRLSRANRLAIALHLTWLIISQPFSQEVRYKIHKYDDMFEEIRSSKLTYSTELEDVPQKSIDQAREATKK